MHLLIHMNFTKPFNQGKIECRFINKLNQKYMRPKAVFFDFDGVLSRDRFYSTLTIDYPQVSEYVNNVIFKGEQKIADRWMRDN